MVLIRPRSAVVLAVILGVCGRVQAQTTLRYKVKEGDQVRYVIEQKIALTVRNKSEIIPLDTNHTIDVLQTVKSVDKDGKAQLTRKCERWRMTMAAPGLKAEVDSKDNRKPEFIASLVAPIIRATAGAEFTMTMDARGEISNIKMPEVVLKQLKGTPLPSLSDTFSEEGLQRLMSENGLVLPTGGVAKGDSWDHKTDMKKPIGLIKVTNSNTYQGAVKRGGQDLELINVKVQMSLVPAAPAKVVFKMKVDDATGTMYFDNAGGRLVEWSTRQVLTLQQPGLSERMDTTITLKLNQ
jgi:hypothetical protein